MAKRVPQTVQYRYSGKPEDGLVSLLPGYQRATFHYPRVNYEYLL
jgi:hypothetical protein